MNNFIIISNSCIGWEIYKRLKIEYTSPFIGSLIPNDLEYIKLCNNIDIYLNISAICNTKPKENSVFYKETGSYYYNHKRIKTPYPIIHLDDIEIHFIHEKNCNLILKKFNKRKNRLLDIIKTNNFKLFNVMVFSEFFNTHNNYCDVIKLFYNNKKYINIFLGPEKYKHNYIHYIQMKIWNNRSYERNKSNVIKWNNQKNSANIIYKYIINTFK